MFQGSVDEPLHYLQQQRRQNGTSVWRPVLNVARTYRTWADVELEVALGRRVLKAAVSRVMQLFIHGVSVWFLSLIHEVSLSQFPFLAHKWSV